ncbi:MAG: UvrD-helicase domain-containing protein, partial [Acidobacteriota bacterium]
GLDPEQAQAAAARHAALVVRAGPGSGKTRLLVARAAELIEDGYVREEEGAEGKVLVATDAERGVEPAQLVYPARE